MSTPTDRSALLSPHLLLLLTMCFWGAHPVFAKALITELPPAALTFWSWLVGTVLLTPFALRHLLAERELIWRHWLKLAAIGSLGVSLFYHLFYNALTFTTAINSGLVAATVPALIIGLSWALYREAISWRTGIGTIVAFLGVLVVITSGDVSVLARFAFNVGDLFMLLAVLCWALYSVLLRYVPPKLNPLAFLWVFAVAGTVFNGVIYVTEAFSDMGFALSWSAVVLIGYVAIFPSLLAYLFYNAGVRALGANIAGQFLYLTPILTAVFAVVFIGEAFRLYHLIGLAVIFAGLFLATWAGGRRAPQAAGH